MTMKLKVDEIASIIREEITQYRRELDVAQVGKVLEVGDGIAEIFGLSEAMAGEMLQFADGTRGQVFNLAENSVGAAIYGPCEKIKAGDTVRATGQLLTVPVGTGMLGRVITPLGAPMDGGGEVRADKTRPVEVIAPGIAARQPVDEPLETGIKAIDAMMPIGRGQRELIIGDRKTGKTAIAVDTIINQKGTGVVCVYVAIGQKESTVAAVVETLRAHDALEHTIVVSSSSSDPAPVQYIAPYSGCAIAEYFMVELGKPTLVVYDDLTKHAAAYRQISLLLRRPPGREAYPGDVFYLHSRLLERACKLANQYVIVPRDTPDSAQDVRGVDEQVYDGPLGLRAAKAALAKMSNTATFKVHRLPLSGGSQTALPICETQEGEVSAYIPTNLISITDGQIYLEPALFFAGVRPAINVGISVSRVGYKAAYKAMRDVAKGLRLDLSAYRELESFAQLGMELDPTSQKQLERGARLVRLLTQPQYQPRPAIDQVIAIYSGTRGYLDDLAVEEIIDFETGLLKYVKEEHRDFYDRFNAGKDLTADIEKELKAIIEKYKATAFQEVRHARRLASRGKAAERR
jgi:F-type H+-transporting ATPase subunit alpha